MAAGGVRRATHASRIRLRRATALLATLVGMTAAEPLHAQFGGNGFLFGRPSGSVTLRGGFSQASARSDLFEDISRDLTIKRGDFSGASYGGEIGVSVTPDLELTIDAGLMRTSTPSSYRNFVDNADREIEQRTVLRRIPFTMNAKLYLAPRGRTIGRFAWIPSRLAPWASVGAGFMNYDFSQTGSFVDFATTNVFNDTFQSDGNTPIAQGRIGADLSLGTRLALTGEGRYLWAKGAPLGSDFVGYAPLDLSGATVSLGLTVRL